MPRHAIARPLSVLLVLVLASLAAGCCTLAWKWGCCDTPPGTAPIVDIDTEPNGNALRFRVDNTVITATSQVGSDGKYRIHPAFTSSVDRARLIKLPENLIGVIQEKVIVSLSGGTSYKGEIVNGQFTWRCYNASGQPQQEIVAGSASDGIPACMRGDLGAEMMKAPWGGRTEVGNWVHIETRQ